MKIVPFTISLCVTVVCVWCVECRHIELCDDDKVDQDKDHTRIIGGKPAKLGEFKALVFLVVGGNTCGSSLIHPSLVLTAAHCFYNDGNQTVTPDQMQLMGDSLRPSYEDVPRQERKATKIVVHHEYDDESKLNDIALVFVDQPFVETDTFRTIKISSKDPVDNELCHVAGWGRTDQDNEDSAPDDLLKIDISVVPMAICNETTDLKGEVPVGSFCAGDLAGGRDTCQGDSGGGLICDGVVRGVVSWGKGCGLPNEPGVYINVNHFKEWIESNSDNLIDLSVHSSHSAASPSSALTIESFILCGIYVISIRF